MITQLSINFAEFPITTESKNEIPFLPVPPEQTVYIGKQIKYWKKYKLKRRTRFG